MCICKKGYNDDEANNVKKEHNNRSKYYRHKRGKYTKKKSFYYSEDSNSSEESDGYVFDINKEEFIFMAMDTKSTNIENEDNQKEKSDFEEEDFDGEGNLEAELISALEEIDKLMGKNIKQKELLQKYEKKDRDLDEMEKKVIILKTQVEEVKRIEEVVRIQLKE